MPVALARVVGIAGIALSALGAPGCALLVPDYEYAEDVALGVDGSVTVDVNASLAALAALHGLPFDPGRVEEADLTAIRRSFEAPGIDVVAVRVTTRAGRPFAFVEIQAADVRALGRTGALSWSSYAFERGEDRIRYRQVVGAPVATAGSRDDWRGDERVAFRLHLPGEIPFHNAPSRRIERGNILVWEQPLVDRLAGMPVDIQVEMQATPILYRTLVLFGAMILLAAAAFAFVIWRVRRAGRAAVR